MKKRILSLVLAALMITSVLTVFPFSASAAEEKTVNNMNDFIEAMKASGTATIKLNRKIECSHKIGSDGHEPIIVNGTKTIDLNGYDLGCKDHSNATNHGNTLLNKSHWFTDCNSTTGNDKIFMKISAGASLTIDDSSKNPGLIFFHGKTVGSVTDAYYDRAHFDGYTTRDLFDVNGTLTINNGEFVPGYVQEKWYSNGVDLDDYDSLGVHFNDHAVEQIFGSVAVVNNGGKLIVNGGTLIGRGIEADLASGVEHLGINLMNPDTWVDGLIEAGTDYVEDLIGDSDDTENVKIRRRDEVIEVKGGNVEINGGTLMGQNGANIFGGNPDGKVKITAGRFMVLTEDYLRVKDDEFHSGKYYGTVIHGRTGKIGIKNDYFADINNAFVAHLGKTYETPEAIKELDIDDTGSIVVIGKKAVTTADVSLVNITPEINDIETDEGYYTAYVGKPIDFSFDAVGLTDEQKANGCTIKKGYKIINSDPNAEATNITKTPFEEGVCKFSHTFGKAGWYEVRLTASARDKDGNSIGSASYKYYFYAQAIAESIKVTTNPTKTKYTPGEKIDTTGMVVTAYYDDGSSTEVTRFTTIAQEGGVKNGQTYFTVEYTQDLDEIEAETLTAKVPITTSAPYEITVNGGYAKTDSEDKASTIYSHTKVTLIPDADPEGKKFVGWTYDNSVEADITKEGDYFTFTMPDGNINIKAVYKNITEETTENPTEKPKNEPPAITITNPFTDVPETEWYHNDVLLAVQQGLVNGKTPTLYKPDDNLLYAEAIKLAACMNQLYMEGEVSLKNGEPWYQTYVDYCKEKGIITKDYNYDDFATRAGYMTIFANALPDEALTAVNYVPDGAIPDVPMGRNYSEPIYKLYRAGILQGSDSQRSCKPLDNIKRSEVAAILSRMMYDGVRVNFSMGEESNQPLAITAQPGQKTAVPGTAAEFTVTVQGGKAPYTYQWKHETGAAKKVTKDIEGETSATIVMIAPTAGGSVSAWCVITDADGNTVTSENAVLKGKVKYTGGGAKDKFKQEDKEELKNEDFLMYAEDVFYITGRNAVVASGRVVKGKLSTGDSITIISSDGKTTKATVAAIEMFHKILDTAEKGDNIGLQFSAEIEKGMVNRGDAIVSGNTSHSVSKSLKGTLKLTSKSEGGRTTAISDGHSPQFYYATDFTGVISGIGTMNPGTTKENVTVTFKNFTGVFYVGQQLSVREGGRTIGTFTITEK